MTTSEAHKSLVSEFIDALFSRGDLSAVDRFLSTDFVDHDPPMGVSADREGLRTAGATFRAAFPDWHSTPYLLIAEDDLVVELFTARGTHRGELMGTAPTGREIALKGINVFRIRDGMISERWGRLDELGFLRQLGVVPEPAV